MIGTILGSFLSDYFTGQDSSFDYLEAFSSLFGDVFDYLFNFIFVDMFNFILERGDYVFQLLYSHVYSNLNTGNFISAIIGMLIFMPILKLVINLLRG